MDSNLNPRQHARTTPTAPRMGAVVLHVNRLIRDFTLGTLTLIPRVGIVVLVGLAAVNPTVSSAPISDLTVAQLVPAGALQLTLIASAFLAALSAAVDQMERTP